MSSQTGAFDKEGYMTSLNSMKLNSATEINDLKKARMLLKAVVKANPQSREAWVAAARIEELDGKLPEARSLLAKACEQFPDSEDVWYEAARLEEPKKQQAFFAQALQKIPTSRKLWLLASQTEPDVKLKIKVLKRALEYLPAELQIWKELVSLSEELEAKVLLEKAVSVLPKEVDLWLALAKLEEYKKAKEVLNQALTEN